MVWLSKAGNRESPESGKVGVCEKEEGGKKEDKRSSSTLALYIGDRKTREPKKQTSNQKTGLTQ